MLKAEERRGGGGGRGHKGCCREEGYNLLSISFVNITDRFELEPERCKLGSGKSFQH